ncbi:hypothetical protein EW146_g3931 [Bondarzewia mesenterica]|uniref:Uncharacterized protein n=1 Tax=Bondarzewia mesenterica TaxID=1095465 RepID=A0A4S4LW40_9AGAM|nr:hypothetical protein EW146_g3931 [Bondarzewia mesenterica]
MGLASAITSLLARKRHESPWEVVDMRSVQPVPVWEDEDGQSLSLVFHLAAPRGISRDPSDFGFISSHLADLDVIYIHDGMVSRTYVFDVRKEQDFENALMFAQQQLLQEVQTKGYNILWREGWQVTLLRKGKKHRVEVRYVARPACVSSAKPLLTQSPPFMGVLREWRQSASHSYETTAPIVAAAA